MKEKRELRTRMREVCAAIPEQEAARQAEMVAAHVAEWPGYHRARTVLLYAALQGELETAALLDRVLADGKRLALPRCGADGGMQAVLVKDWRALQWGRFGVREPALTSPALEAREIDMALIPGLAFDGAGHRLGRGKGYFDRFLAQTEAVAAGLAYEEQVLPRVPTEAHDCGVQYVITARGVQATHYEGGWIG